jgi:hypothetical protein
MVEQLEESKKHMRLNVCFYFIDCYLPSLWLSQINLYAKNIIRSTQSAKNKHERHRKKIHLKE